MNTITITLDDLRWHDRYKIERILKQLDEGLAVALFLLDGGWKGESIQKGSARYSRMCVLNETRSDRLLGVYQVNDRTKRADLERIIIQDLYDYRALALKNVR